MMNDDLFTESALSSLILNDSNSVFLTLVHCVRDLNSRNYLTIVDRKKKKNQIVCTDIEENHKKKTKK